MNVRVNIYLSDIIRDAVKKKRLKNLLQIIKRQDKIYDKIPRFKEKYFYYIKDILADYKKLEKRYKQ